jgi:hypothetical protein
MKMRSNMAQEIKVALSNRASFTAKRESDKRNKTTASKKNEK